MSNVPNITGYKLLQMYFSDMSAWKRKEEEESKGKEVLVIGVNNKYYVYEKAKEKIPA